MAAAERLRGDQAPGVKAVVVGLAALLAVTVLSGRGKTAGWPPHHHVLALALGAGAVAVAAWLSTTRTRAAASAIAAALVGLVVVVGYPIQRNYLHRRYAVGVQVDRWARSVHGARIGMVGYPAQYPLLGLDLTNRVEYVGARVAYGGIQTAKTCSQWRRFVDRADYDFVVTGTNKWGLEQADETAWTRGDPNAVEVLQSPAASVFALRGRLDPGRC